MTDHGAPETVPKNYAMTEVLKRIEDLSVQETAQLKRRQNHDHSLIYRLPQELITEVLILAVDWSWWDVEKLRTLASVSTAWRDTILSCNRFWPVIDVMASEEARTVAMKRNREGPVDVWCWERPSESAIDKFMIDLQTVKPTRMRSILYEFCRQSRSFMDWLRSNTSNIIDIFLANLGMNVSEAHLDLSPEGPNLRHIDLRRMSLQWQSPRLSNLQTVFLANLSHNLPSVNHLYNILSSSPNLERLCLLDLVAPDDQALGSISAAAPPINLPVLKTLAFNSVSTAITRSIVPLIRTPACHTVMVRKLECPALVELQRGTIELVAKAITLSRTMQLKVEVDEGPYVHICSEPMIPKEWVYWAHDEPGVDIKLAIPSAEMLPRLWDYLGDRLRIHRAATRITSLEIEWEGQTFPFPFALLEHFTALTDLRFDERLGTTLQPLLQFLGGSGMNGVGSPFPLPNLSGLRFFAKTVPNWEECVNGTKELLERRYPALHDNIVSGDVQVLKDLCLPFPLVDALQNHTIMTSLDIGNVRGL